MLVGNVLLLVGNVLLLESNILVAVVEPLEVHEVLVS